MEDIEDIYTIRIAEEDIKRIQQIDRQNFWQNNSLMQAILLQPFKVLEIKALCLISRYINQSIYTEADIDMKNTVVVRIPSKDFCRSLNIDPSHFARTINALESLMDKVVEIRKTKDSPHNLDEGKLVLFSFVGKNQGKGEAVFHMNSLLLPYLQYLRKNFTVFSLDQINKFNSAYSLRMYLILKQYQGLHKRENLKEM